MPSVFIVPAVLVMTVVVTTPLFTMLVRVRKILFELLFVFIVPNMSRLGLGLSVLMAIVVHKCILLGHCNALTVRFIDLVSRACRCRSANVMDNQRSQN